MSAPIVEVRNLVKRYGDVVALDHFDLRIEPGEIFLGFWVRTLGQDDGHQLHIAAAHFRQGRHLPVRRAHDAHALRPEAQDRRGAAERGAVRGAHGAGEHRLLLRPVRGRSARAGAARGRGHRVRGPRGLREVPPAQALRRPSAAAQHRLRHRPQAPARLLRRADGGGGSAEPQRHSGGHPPA